MGTPLNGLFLRAVLAVLMAGAGILSGCTSDLADKAASPHRAGLTFTEVTPQAGLTAFKHVKGGSGKKWAPEPVGGGGGFIDYNSDGWLDILLVGGARWKTTKDGQVPALWLYRNNGDGTFTRQTKEAGLSNVSAYGFGIAAADYDNDGDEDFFFSTLEENKLFQNKDGVFTEVGQKAGIADEAFWSTSAVFFDADRDGHLDLFVCNYVDWTPRKEVYCHLGGEKAYCTPEVYDGVASRFYHNNGDGTFTEQTQKAGLMPAFDSTLDKALGVVQLDYNRDGWPDLLVANDTERDMLYKNNADGTFTEKGRRLGIAFNEHGKPRAGMGVDAGVVDSSGYASVFVGNFAEEMVGVYRYTSGGAFIDRASISRIGHPSLRTLTFGLFLFDADYDTDLDLFTANGHVQPRAEQVQKNISYKQPPQLYLNNGDGRFEEVTRRMGGLLKQPMVARGAAYGDYDQDGDLDVLVTENDGPAHLWRNDLNDASFLRVHVEGRTSNRDGIGTRIIAVKDGLRMERQIRSGSSYLSQSEKVAAFGLGGASRVDSLIIKWPSGRENIFLDVAADQVIKVIEGTGRYALLPAGRMPAWTRQ